MNRDEIHDEIAQALVASGCGYGSPVVERFADVVIDIALPEGPYGYCSSRDCRNPAINDIGLPVCIHCDQANDFGASWATASSDAMNVWAVVIEDGWTDAVEDSVRHKVAAEFAALAAAASDPVMQLVWRNAADQVVAQTGTL